MLCLANKLLHFQAQTLAIPASLKGRGLRKTFIRQVTFIIHPMMLGISFKDLHGPCMLDWIQEGVHWSNWGPLARGPVPPTSLAFGAWGRGHGSTSVGSPVDCYGPQPESSQAYMAHLQVNGKRCFWIWNVKIDALGAKPKQVDP